MRKLFVMFFALLAALTLSASKFAKVTSAPQDWSGQYLIAYNASGTAYVFNGMDASQDYQPVSIPANDTIESDALDDYVVEFAAMAGGVSFKRMVSGKYMFGTSGENSLKMGDVAAAHTIFFGTPDSIEIKCDGTFFVYNSTKGQERFRYFGKQTTYAPSTYKRLTLFKAVETIKPAEWTPDTLSVSEAIQLIDDNSPLKNKTHYIKGIVRDENYGTTWPGYAMMWLLDIDNDALQLEGYKIYKDAKGTKWQNKSDIPCGAGDTVLLFADGLDYYAQNKIYETTSGYFVEITGKATPWTPDTLTVAEAIVVIRDSTRNEKGELLMNKSHFIKGVIKDQNYGTTWPGYAMMWLSDIDQPELELEGYKIYKDKNGTKWKNAEEIPCGVGDTVLLFADGLTYYAQDKKYETTSGYFVEVSGKLQMTDLTTVFPYGYGAIVGEAADNKYHFDVVLTRTEDYDINNAIHLGIVSSKEKGINGSYSLYAESSHIDGEPATPINGSVQFTYAGKGESWNQYKVVATFTAGENHYRIDGLYELPAIWLDEYGEASDIANLDDDVPYQPNEGDTITCEQALSYAKSLGTEVSPIKVYVRGWVVSKPTTSDYNMSQRNFYINDDPKASKGIVQSYFCFEQGMDSIAKGNEVLLYGNIKLFNDVAEIEKGQIYRLTGTEQHYRDIQCVEEKQGAVSVAQAMEIGMALKADPGQTVETPGDYTVVGYIAKVDFQTKNDTATWFMTDDQESTFGDLQAYKCYIPALITHGDKVMVTGKIAKFVKDDGSKTTIEFRFSRGEFVCQVPSENEEIEATEDVDGKFILNGRFMIRYNKYWYNAQGNPYCK
ncbi:MAG: hypothetical protein MJZ64_01730 [Paludibacteraceae bacterium]|nr:hypothetical protein [Paludibacteraceae bacterium]